MYIPFTIKMKVILVFLFRFYTIHKNVRTHIKCTEENSKKANGGIYLVLVIQGLSCLPRQTESTTQTQTHMFFLQQSQLYAITFFSSKSISSFNFICLNINGFRSIKFKIPNKHYCIWDHKILFKNFSISRFLNSFSRLYFIFFVELFWFVWVAFWCKRCICYHFYHTLNSPCSIFCLVFSSTRSIFAYIITKLCLKCCILIIQLMFKFFSLNFWLYDFHSQYIHVSFCRRINAYRIIK